MFQAYEFFFVVALHACSNITGEHKHQGRQTSQAQGVHETRGSSTHTRNVRQVHTTFARRVQPRPNPTNGQRRTRYKSDSSGRSQLTCCRMSDCQDGDRRHSPIERQRQTAHQKAHHVGGVQVPRRRAISSLHRHECKRDFLLPANHIRFSLVPNSLFKTAFNFSRQ